MSIGARLKRLERTAGPKSGPLYIVTRYADETEAQARAAYPELEFPERLDTASILYIPRAGNRPAVRPSAYAPGYDPRGLGVVLREIDGKTSTIDARERMARHEHQEQTGPA